MLWKFNECQSILPPNISRPHPHSHSGASLCGPGYSIRPSPGAADSHGRRGRTGECGYPDSPSQDEVAELPDLREGWSIRAEYRVLPIREMRRIEETDLELDFLFPKDASLGACSNAFHQSIISPDSVKTAATHSQMALYIAYYNFAELIDL